MPRVSRIALCLVLVAISAGCSRTKPPFDGFTFSPDGTYITAIHSRSGSSFIYKIPIDTGKAMRLTNAAEGFEGIPSFSPDGKRIAYSYSAGQQSRSRIVIASVDGSSSHTWPTSEANDFSPLFLPDNKTIVFARSGYYGNYSPIAPQAHHQWNFYVGDLDGTNIHQLTNDDFYMVSRASISPDGKTLLFVSSESHGDVIAICSLEQPPMPRLVLKPRVQNRLGEAVISDAMFLPDGKNILFSAATDGAGGSYDYDIYRMELHAQTVEKLTTANGYSYGLQLSPDGRTGLFVKNIPHWYGDEAKVFLLDLVTRKLTPLNITGLE